MTLSSQVLPDAFDALDFRLAAEFSVGADFAGDAGNFRCERPQLIHHRVHGVLELQDLALGIDRDFLREVALRDRGRDFCDVSDLGGQIIREQVDVVGQILPDAGDVWHFGLRAQLPFHADRFRDAGDLLGEDRERLGHAVERISQGRDLALRRDFQFWRQVAVGNRRDDSNDTADLGRQVRRHEIDVVGQVLPDARHAAHFRLAAEFSFGADFARDAGNFRRERVELIHHRVHGVFQLEDFALRIDGDLFRKVAFRDRGGNFRDVSDLRGEIVREQVDVVGQIFPRARDARNFGLRTQLSFHADGTRHVGNLFSEQAQRCSHAVDGVGQCRDLTARVHDQFLRQVAVGDRGDDLDDAADLGGQVRRHEIDVVGQVLPDARHAFHFGLAAEFSLGADFARDAGNFRGERSKLIHHGVHGVLQFEDFALNIDGDFLRQVAVGDRGRDGCDISHLVGQVAREHVDVVGQILPGARHAFDLRLAAELAVGADFLGDAGNFVGERAELIDHRVNRGADSQELALHRLAVDFERHLLAQVTECDRTDNAGDFSGRLHQAADQRIDRVFDFLPSAACAPHGRALGHSPLAPDGILDPDYLAGDRFVALGDGVESHRELVEQLVLVGDLEPNRKIALTGRSQCLDQVSETPLIRVFAGSVMSVSAGLVAVGLACRR